MDPVARVLGVGPGAMFAPLSASVRGCLGTGKSGCHPFRKPLIAML